MGRAVKYWSTLKSDPNAKYQKSLTVDASKLSHRLHGGQVRRCVDYYSKIPDPTEFKNNEKENQLLDL